MADPGTKPSLDSQVSAEAENVKDGAEDTPLIDKKDAKESKDVKGSSKDLKGSKKDLTGTSKDPKVSTKDSKGSKKDLSGSSKDVSEKPGPVSRGKSVPGRQDSKKSSGSKTGRQDSVPGKAGRQESATSRPGRQDSATSRAGRQDSTRSATPSERAAAARALQERRDSEKALAIEEARDMLDNVGEDQQKRKELARKKGRTRRETILSTKSYTPSLEVLAERPSEKNMEDLMQEESERRRHMSKSHDGASFPSNMAALDTTLEPLEPLGALDKEPLSASTGALSKHSQDSISLASSALSVPSAILKTLVPDSVEDVNHKPPQGSEEPKANGQRAFPPLDRLYSDISDFTDADTDLGMERPINLIEEDYRRQRLESQCDALPPVPRDAEKKKKKWAFFKKRKDHSKHEMFVRLDELGYGPNEELRWAEKARWIKFEEDVEEEAQRWGKPHLASLSFRSMVDLRKCIKKGAVLLDLEEEDLASIAHRIVEQLVYIDQLEPEDKKPVLKVLLQKHRHTDENKISIRKSISSRARKISSSSLKSHASAKNPPGPSKKTDRQISQTDSIVSGPQSPGAGTIDLQFPDTNFSGKRQEHVKINLDDMTARLIKDEQNQSQNNNKQQDDKTSVEVAMGDDNAFEEGQGDYNPMLSRLLKGAEATLVMVGSLDYINQPVSAFVRLAKARYLGNLMEVPLPIRFIFVLLVPPDELMDHYEVGRSISALMANPDFRDTMYDVQNRSDILDAILDYLDDSIVLPPGEWDKKTLLPIIEMSKKAEAKKKDVLDALEPPAAEKFGDPLKRTKRPFGGLVNDIKRRFPMYLSDIKDGLNLQCLATILFIYFAALSPAITFGGLLTEKTGRWLGVSEMLIGVSVCGIVFSLFSGQPLLIVGATGPLLVFEEALYQICVLLDLDFISLRVWVGLWVTLITIIVVALEGSFFIHYFTRFIHEIFSALIALILILETIKKLVFLFIYHPLKPYYPDPDVNYTVCEDNITSIFLRSDPTTNMTMLEAVPHNASYVYPHNSKVTGQPNTAFLSTILCFGTFFIAYALRGIKRSKYLGKYSRQILGDFAIPIAIALMVLADYLIKAVYTEKLAVPDGIAPTDPKRGWFINPMGSSEKQLPVWGIFFAIVPALLMFILVFMETEVTTMILDQKERQLKKGSGYHLDLLLVGAFATVCGFVGFPFVCPATLRSISHISALSVWSRTVAPGEKAILLEVKEQRVTSFFVHILIGVSVLMGPLLREVPIAVLFGVFFYMGVVAMHGLQLVDRFRLLFTHVKHHPAVGYVTKVRTYKMHLFTIIQLLCLALLGVVKFTKGALAFPFILLLLVPLRLVVLKFIFTEKELEELDNEEGEQQRKQVEENVVFPELEEEAELIGDEHTAIYNPVNTPEKTPEHKV